MTALFWRFDETAYMHTLICNTENPAYTSSRHIQIPYHKRYKTPNIPYKYVISEDFGQLYYYEIPAGQFKISYHLMEFQAPVELTFIEKMEVPEIFIPLWSQFSYSVAGIGEFSYAPHEFGLRYFPNLESTSVIQGTWQPSILRVKIPLSFLAELSIAYNKLNLFYSRVIRKEAAAFSFQSEPFATAEMRDNIEEILHSIFDADVKELYLDSLMRSFTICAIDKMMRAKDILILPLSSLSPSKYVERIPDR